jgi:hypothetical protein
MSVTAAALWPKSIAREQDVRDTKLDAHPESFQLEKDSPWAGSHFGFIQISKFYCRGYSERGLEIWRENDTSFDDNLPKTKKVIGSSTLFFEFRDFGCSEPTRSGDYFILAFVQFAHQQRSENALAFEAGCQFAEAVFIKSPRSYFVAYSSNVQRFRKNPVHKARHV